MKSWRRLFPPVIIWLSINSQIFSQEHINYNQYYKFPFSIGVEYQSLSPFSDYDTDFNMFYDLSAIFHLPIPKLPVLQPLLQLGMISFLTPEREDSFRWQHTHWYAAAGIGLANRFSKNFEIGLELAGGASEAVFPELDPTGVPRGSTNLLAAAGARIGLDPSYNMSIDINPSLKYFYSLTPLTRFNGLVFGIGFSGNYRFGEDPDAPQAIIRSLKLSESRLPSLFAAMQSYYAKNSFGKFAVTNVDKYEVSDLEVSFFQAGFMDSPTKLASIPSLKSGESREVELYASFNQNVFTTEGVTPLTGELTADYRTRNRAVKQTFSVAYDLHDKTSLTWDDDSKVGAFITPADSALRNYASFIRQSSREGVVDNFSESLQVAMQVFYALKEIGCLYQVDPTAPFTAAQGNPQVVDSISLPRDTLKRLTGDCDDLTVLYCSLLETVGVETAFITVPGHIYAAVNTKTPSKSYSQVHPDKEMTMNIRGELWVPVEITMIGTDDFLSAWRKGIEEYKVFESSPEKRAITLTSKAQETFRPVGLRETDLGLQYGNKRTIVEDFTRSMDKLIDLVLEGYAESAQKAGNKEGYNRLGIIAAHYGRYPQAQKAFNTALAMDRNFLSPKINLANIAFLKGEFQNALKTYHQSEEALRGQESSPVYRAVLLNISRSYYELENYDRASDYFSRLAALDPALVEQYAYLASRQGAGRGSEAGSLLQILFAGEGE